MAYKEERWNPPATRPGSQSPIGGPVMTDVRGWKPVRQDGDDDEEEEGEEEEEEEE
jgi:hypothetical protein